MDRLSGDQKTPQAPSVPGTTRMSAEARSRIQMLLPLAPVAVSASRFPSGEMAKGWRVIDGEKIVLGGAGISNCSTWRGAWGVGRPNHQTRAPANNRTASPIARAPVFRDGGAA